MERIFSEIIYLRNSGQLVAPSIFSKSSPNKQISFMPLNLIASIVKELWGSNFARAMLVRNTFFLSPSLQHLFSSFCFEAFGMNINRVGMFCSHR